MKYAATATTIKRLSTTTLRSRDGSERNESRKKSSIETHLSLSSIQKEEDAVPQPLIDYWAAPRGR